MNDQKNYDTLKKEYDKLNKRCALMEQILDNLHEGVFVTDTNHRVTYFNRTEAENEGFQEKDIGKDLNEIYAGRDVHYELPDPIAVRVMETGKPDIEQFASYNSLKGTQIHTYSSCYPFCYNNRIEGVFAISRPILAKDPYINALLSYEKRIEEENDHEKGSAYYYFDDIIGNSIAINEAIDQANKIAQYNMPVLIIGETGTGKEMFAQSIHNAGKSACGDFVAVNCAAVPETLLEGILFGVAKGAYTGASATTGLFVQAEDGSIFLDEVNSMPISLQIKLLRALQEKRVRPLGGKKEIPINCRIISSSNVDPFDINEKKSRQIRQDLLFRLASATSYIPPLRERKEDIPELCRHFVQKNIQGTIMHIEDLSPLLLEALYNYDWPGNVRELQNIISTSLLNVDVNDRILKVEHMPVYFKNRMDGKQIYGSSFFHPARLKEAMADYERKIIVDTLLRYNGNISKSAKALQITRPSLYSKIEKLGIGELLSTRFKRVILCKEN